MLWYNNFTECYIGLIEEVYNNPDYISAPRGLKVKERLGVAFGIRNPRARLPYIVGRKFSITYMIAELLWYLSGENSTEWIANYSSFWRSISDDGETANSAYGARIFKSHPWIAEGVLNQWNYVKSELKQDPDSRRAVIHIRTPSDSVHAKLDVPCTLTLQFFIRDGALHLMVNMRSSDIILGIAYDIPAFTLMQELLAMELGVETGTYMHVSNSLHIYERHFDMCEKIISNLNKLTALKLDKYLGAMPSMPTLPPVDKLYYFEKQVRICSSAKEVMQVIELAHAEFDHSYWKDWIRILAAHRLGKIGCKKEKRNLLASTAFAGYQYYKI
jgi:thymidylate synthase